MEYGLVALWLLTYLALLYIGMPLARAIMPDLTDSGAGVALPVALAVVWLVVFFLGRLTIALSLWVGLVLLAVMAAGLWYRGYEIDHRAYVRVALVFTTAFCFLIAIRAVDPAAHPGGGEKFLDMSLLQSSLRATTVPPEDVWFAGETVRYYYGGHLLASLLARITDTEARFAYNLALSGFYAMLVTAAYGLAGSIAAHRGFSYRRAGVASAFFVGIASNLLTIFRFGGAMFDSIASKLGILGLPFDIAALVWYWFAGLFIPLPREWGMATSLTEFSYWPASRVLQGAITEFPLFAWLNGDLHAHMMSTPFLLLLAAVLFQLFVAGTTRPPRRTLLTLFGIVPAVGAIIAVVNTWSFPAVGGLVVLTFALCRDPPLAVLTGGWTPASQSRWPLGERELRRLAVAIVVGVIVLALAWALSSPYWLFESSNNTRPAFLPDRSTLAELLLAHGAFLLLYWLYLYRHSKPVLVSSPSTIGLVVLTVVTTTLLGVPAVGLFVPLVLIGWIMLRQQYHGTVRRDDSSPIDTAATAADGGRSITPLGFETVLVIAMAGLVVLVEFLYVKETAAGGRFNTVFKVYMQAWVLGAVAAGVVLTRLVDEHVPALGLSGPRWRRRFVAFGGLLVGATSLYAVIALAGHFGLVDSGDSTIDLLSGIPGWVVVLLLLGGLAGVAALAFRVIDGHGFSIGGSSDDIRGAAKFCVGLLVVLAALYGTLGVTSSYAPSYDPTTSDPSLDALKFVERSHPDEAPAIYWLNDEVRGQPNMLSHPGAQYRWDNAPSSLTGVPTVLGKGPERAYRGPDVFDRRYADVETMFTGQPAEQRRLLDQYDVELIYVGPDERSAYSDLSVTSLEAVTVAKQWSIVTIYRVDQDAL